MRDEEAGEGNVIEMVLKLAQACDYEKGHSEHVTNVALRLFDELRPLHHLGQKERLYLRSAALLHDVGLLRGLRRHHKSTREIILSSKEFPFADEEKVIVALVARYHRRALPKDSHKYFSDLKAGDKEIVRKLASLLRVADGLDRTHMSAVKDLTCDIHPDRVIIHVEADEFEPWDKEAAKKKADLFEDVFRRELVIDWASE
jgi:exopolyphosphatase/guanosine-5'-triphosphate,3'-diphosphate pyrophosphatase